MQQTNQYNAKNTRYLLLCAALILLLMLVLMPQFGAQALYFVTDGTTHSILYGTNALASDRIIVTGAHGANPGVMIRAGEKVTVIHGDTVEYATTRSLESVEELLERLKIAMSPIEMAVVDISGDEVTVEIRSDFTCYETVTEPVAYTTVYTPGYDVPKGEIRVTQEGVDGTREVVYEVTYADGTLVSRQAVDESSNSSVPELIQYGTLVPEVQPGDTVAKIEYTEDGGGYLVMKSGDSIHFSTSKEVTCTAYTMGGLVDEETATGTIVHTGVVAVDRRVIPLGTKMYVLPSGGCEYGVAVAEDTGVRGAVVDLYMDTLEECVDFGCRKNSVVYFLD